MSVDKFHIDITQQQSALGVESERRIIVGRVRLPICVPVAVGSITRCMSGCGA